MAASKVQRLRTHPGEVLLEQFMKPLGLTANKLATDLRVPATRIGEIIHQRRGVSAETAMRLARYFGTTPEFWVNLQTAHDLSVTVSQSAKQIDREIQPRSAA